MPSDQEIVAAIREAGTIRSRKNTGDRRTTLCDEASQ